MTTRATMTLQEKVLYHQVHPLKLGADITAAVVSTYFFWQQSLVLGLLAMFVPPIVMSTLLLATQDFTWIRDSAVGRYLKRSMTHAMEAVRLSGTLPMVFGAWYHLPWLIALGLPIVLFGWLRGLLFPGKAPTDAISPLP
jgi:hypothetical protein